MGYLQDGKDKEKEFFSLFSRHQLATDDEDMFNHIDGFIMTGVDVKAMKNVQRKNNNPDENHHWIELVNVNGNDGWLYGGADMFAFETVNYWILVYRKKLIEFVDKNVSNEIVQTPTLYKLYQRKDRQDKITLIKTLDLCYLAHKMLVKKP